MRLLFIAIPEKGHLNPMIGPAVHLQRRGHAVAFYSAGEISGQLERVGLKQVAPGSARAQEAEVNRGERFAEQVRDPLWLRSWIEALLVDGAEAQIPGIEKAIQLFQPDLLVLDPMIYAAAIAAHRAALPWVSLSNSLNPLLDVSMASDLLETVRVLAPSRERLFARHGLALRFRGCDMLSPRLTVAFTTGEFIGRQVADVQMVGPSLPPAGRGDEVEFPWERLPADRPVVYLSFGSQIYHQPAIFERVIEATRRLEMGLVIVANQLHGSPGLSNLPGHVITCHSAPQLQLLPRVQAFITHGGANSVMEAIRFGMPMLISPVCNDQFHQAHWIARAGIGRVLDLSVATLDQCCEAIPAVLHDPAIRAAMTRVSASYQVDGASRAADLIEQLP